jgi:hypothetical protein
MNFKFSIIVLISTNQNKNIYLASYTQIIP